MRKIACIGAGSFVFTRAIFRDLLTFPAFHDCEIALMAINPDRLERITARDGISREAAAARIDAQRPDSYYESNCTHILLNHADEASFREDCRRLYKEILNHG